MKKLTHGRYRVPKFGETKKTRDNLIEFSIDSKTNETFGVKTCRKKKPRNKNYCTRKSNFIFY